MLFWLAMFTVVLISRKGGAGKTTLACGLAVSSEQAGLVTALVDLDPQGSASAWANLRTADTPTVISGHAAQLPALLTAACDAGAELAIIDTAPHSTDAALAAARAADLVLIPCRASRRRPTRDRDQYRNHPPSRNRCCCNPQRRTSARSSCGPG